MSLTKCSNRLVSALIEALMFGAKHGHIEQSERLLAALHVLRPNFVELHAYDAWMMIRRRDFAEAVRLLRPLEQQALRGSFGPYVAALLAVSLCGSTIQRGASTPTRLRAAMKTPIPSSS